MPGDQYFEQPKARVRVMVHYAASPALWHMVYDHQPDVPVHYNNRNLIDNKVFTEAHRSYSEVMEAAVEFRDTIDDPHLDVDHEIKMTNEALAQFFVEQNAREYGAENAETVATQRVEQAVADRLDPKPPRGCVEKWKDACTKWQLAAQEAQQDAQDQYRFGVSFGKKDGVVEGVNLIIDELETWLAKYEEIDDPSFPIMIPVPGIVEALEAFRTLHGKKLKTAA